MSYEEKKQELKDILSKRTLDEKKLMEFIGKTKREERERIAKDLSGEYPVQIIFDEKLEGKFKDLCKRLFEKRSLSELRKIDNSFGTFSIDDDVIFEMLFNAPDWLKKKVIDKFSKEKNKDLLEELQSNFTNPVKKNLELFLKGKRNKNCNPDPNECQKTAKLLIQEDPKTWMNNDEIMYIFATYSPEELLLTARYYYKLSGKKMLSTLEELPASQRKFMTDLFYYVICPPEKYARTLMNVLKEGDAPDNVLMDIIADRYDVDMMLIKKFYYLISKETLKSGIESQEKGNYKDLLIQLINKESSNDK